MVRLVPPIITRFEFELKPPPTPGVSLRMASPVFPLEIWLNIFERACQDDGTTGLSLSMTSQEMRLMSNPYRYQSVQIKGWKQLLLFEERFSRLPENERGLVNLLVDLETVFEVGYPSVPLMAPGGAYLAPSSGAGSEESEDPKDSGGSDSSWLEDEDEEKVTDDDSESGSDPWDTEDELEFNSPSISEQLELKDDSEFLRIRVQSPHSLFQDGSSTNMTLEDLQKDVSYESRRAEGFGYAALHRVLMAASGSLETFTLLWAPVNGFSAGGFFPILPHLRSFTTWETWTKAKGDVLPRNSGCGWDDQEAVSWALPEEPARFPSLKRLEYNGPFSRVWFDLENFNLDYISTSCSMFRLSEPLPAAVKGFRTFCICPSRFRCTRYPGLARAPQASPALFKKRWLEQVVRCSVLPGFEQGSSPVMVVAWVKGVYGYQDAVLITDENGCIRLWDYKHRLEPHGIHPKLSLELYDPKQNGWVPVSWWDTLGPVSTGKNAFLFREAGTSVMRHFDQFESIAHSAKAA